jgi:plastocyanin
MRHALRCAMLGAGLCASAALFAAEPARTLAVKMQKEAFVPAKATVAAGTQVTWTNTDTVPHSVTADDKRFDSGAILSGKTFVWTADGAGAVAYHCIFHPSMTAVLDVRATAKKTAH